VEFIYATGNHTVILKEDGTELLNEEGRVPQPGITHSQEYRRPIYNTPDGTKLILSDTQGGASYVYSLPCSLSTGIGGLINGDGLVDIAKAYPNPSSDYCRLEYKLPTGVDEALLVLFDSKGTEVAQFRIDRSFSDLLIPVYDYLPGVYVYQLIANGERMAEERIVIQH